MKRKIYTLSHDVDLLKEIDNNGGQFTAEEHAYAIEKEFGKTVFKTRENLLRHYLPGNLPKLGSLGFLIDSTKRNGYKNILSLGAGQCVLEYLVKMSLPEESQVVACDFDSFFVKKAKEFFPEIIAERFDFFKDEIESLQAMLNIEFDCVVFFGSAYVMDDMEFIKLFSDLKKVGVKQIIDFHAGYMDSKAVIMNYLKPLTMNSTLRKMFHKPPITSWEYSGKFHGYSRNRSELRRLYKNSGLKLQEEISLSGYKYVAILG
jgi:predicted RNA methylase